MSGYGGQPSGWSDPYGQQNGGWQDTPSAGWSDPYGQYNAPQHPSYGYGPPGVPGHGQRGNGLAIAALVCNILLVTSCCNVLAIPGIVTASLAISRTGTDPESARSMTVWSWVIFVLALVVAIAVFIVLVVLDINSSSSSYDDSGSI